MIHTIMLINKLYLNFMILSINLIISRIESIIK